MVPRLSFHAWQHHSAIADLLAWRSESVCLQGEFKMNSEKIYAVTGLVNIQALGEKNKKFVFSTCFSS